MSEAILANIKRIRKSASTLTTLVQETALACAQHAQAHGDVALMTALFDAVGNSLRRDALSAWLSQFFPMAVHAAKAQTKAVFWANDKRYAVYLDKDWQNAYWGHEEAAATMWTDVKAENAPTPFNVFKAVHALIKKAQKSAEKGLLADGWTDKDTAVVVGLGNLIGETVEFKRT